MRSASGLPAELAALCGSIDGALGVGAPGKAGVLELGLAPRGGVTRIIRHYQQAPLYIYRPIYLDPALPGMAFLFTQQAGDGLVQGDRYRVEIGCAPGTAIHLTTQAATNVFASPQNIAAQTVGLHADAGALIEYMPDAVVPFRGSRFFQRTSITAEESATVVIAETILPGRVAHGEAHEYDLYWSETEARRPDGTLLFTDTLRLGALAAPPRSRVVLDDQAVLATMFVISGRVPPEELVVRLRQGLNGHPVIAGVSELPGRCGVAVRLLALDSSAASAALRAVWDMTRREVVGAPAPDLRKGHASSW